MKNLRSNHHQVKIQIHIVHHEPYQVILKKIIYLDQLESVKGPGFSFRKTKAEMDKIEKYIIESGDQIGSNLDQLKIKIYDWNEKIIKTTKQVEKLKKNAKKSTNKKAIDAEIKGKLLIIILIETCRKVAGEYSQFHTDIKASIEDSRTVIDARKDKLVLDVEHFEAKLNKETASRLKHSRGKHKLYFILDPL
jgi:hypothetical protein